ncbi:penicillin acylase family protein [Paraburkholderia sp. BCC1885]|uniref:penicillin acylase family protein n=1 Tax=Paraburkholderia sp. BCC1885 TaxID=2562669 RepID=UPI0016428222|nr:penicillin acylase family protein [Paraburkholderia sp. BCC1885]
MATLLFLIVEATRAATVGNVADQVEIRRTAFGIPHIKAVSERGLGYGIGFAYAQDNACLLEDDVATVSGTRSMYWGPESKTEYGATNLETDFFFRWFNSQEAVDRFWIAQPPGIQALMTGYADGFNRYIAQQVADGQAPLCGGGKWVKAISTDDLVRLTRRLLIHAGLGQFIRAIVAAAPPTSAAHTDAQSSNHVVGQPVDNLVDLEQFSSRYGSNGLAIGGAMSRNGKGILLGNPHFPWDGPLRFYQMQLTIPGKLDVMGAALPGLPVVNIGFNQHVAWTHTVDSSVHFTIYRLSLGRGNSMEYAVDGQLRPIKKTTVTVDVLTRNGMTQRYHSFYESADGPLIVWPGHFGWTDSSAYALRDPNVDNTRALAQWYLMDGSKSLDGLRAALVKTLGIPWVDTVAADSKGQVMFANVSVIPAVDDRKLASCGVGDIGESSRLVVLDGSRSECNWVDDVHAPQAGVFAGTDLPVVIRNDFVQNSNDSAWLVNPAAPVEGYPVTVSRDGVPVGARGRFALHWVSSLRVPDGKAGQSTRRVGPDDLAALVTGNSVFLASISLDDMLRLCPDVPSGTNGASEGITAACSALRTWDRTANASSGLGYVYFAEAMNRVLKMPGAWTTPFDPARPLDTPSGLNIANAGIASAIRAALVEVDRELTRADVSPETTWGSLQVSDRQGRPIPIPGGDGTLGVYNAIQSVPDKSGRRDATYGSSYIQVVSFTRSGPVARTLLTFSESSDPASPHFADQTWLFSKSQWVQTPFSEQDIASAASDRPLTLDVPSPLSRAVGAHDGSAGASVSDREPAATAR